MVAVAAVSSAFAKVTDTRTFESESDVSAFVVDGEAGEDASALAAYDEDRPAVTAPYPCEGYGDNYFSLDTGSATLWRTNTAVGNVYFDMAMQFNPSKVAPTVGNDTKVAVYMNANSNIVVVAGDGSGNRVQTEYAIDNVQLAPGEWGRLTLCAVDDGGLVFKAYLNSTNLTSGGTSSFQCLTEDTTVTQFGISGSGAIDDFVIRTTDPFIENPAVTIGGEGYASLADALADDPTATPQLETDVTLATPLAYGESISVKLNNHTLSGITSGSLIALASTSGDVTTYTAGYFPRTATAGQDGTAAHPYEIADADDLVALQNAILADAANGTTFASKSYVQTANIDMTGVDGFYGIGWFASSTSFASVPSGVASDGKTSLPFAGTYDGQGFTISNVTIVKHTYAGVFNNVSGTVKNLTVQDVDCSGTCSEWGCAIVGNAAGGSLLENLTAVTSTGFDWGSSANHNVAGIVVRPIGAATIRGCVNNAAITAVAKRVGGIAAFVGSGSTGTVFDSCTNNAALVSTDGTRGVGGILGCAEGGVKNAPTADDTIIRNCVDFGSETAGPGGNAAAIVGSNWNASYTYTDDGGNTFKASTVDCCGITNAVFGRAYALPVTIDAADYLMTVKQADLAAGNTYTLLDDVSASETSVYTFDAAGTIAFNTNGYNFAGTVAAVSTLGVVGPSVSGSVLSYSAGVAAVDDVAYATFADALAALATSSDTYVTLLADASTSFSEVGSIAVRLDGHTLTVDYGNFAGSDSFDASTGITTYTAAAVVATVGSDKFATLQAAIDAAVAGATKTVNLVGAATDAVTIPEGITVQLSTGYSLAGVTTLAGSGVLKMPWGESPQPTIQLLCQQSTWEGTLYVQGVDINSAINLTLLGNTNSTVCFNSAGCAFTTGSTTAHAIKALEVGPNGFDIIGNYASGTFTFPCALTGTGNLKIAVKNSDGATQKVVKFTGDVSGFTGSINFDSNANCAVYFGESAGNGNCISVAADKSVTVAAGKTWTAPAGFVVQGNMTVNGTLDGGNKLYGTGTITFNAATSLVVANTWTGTYIANFKADNNAIFYIPVNASATTVINGVNGEFGGYPNYNGDAPNVAGPVTLNANWTIANGWYGPDHTTTFAKLSGSGDLTVAGTWSGDNPIYYTITELDGYTGTLGGRRGAFTIGKVNVAEQPTDGARVVKMAIGANGSMLSDDVPLYVAGVDSGATLTYEVSGASGEGLYYYAPVYDVNFFKDAGKTEKIGETQSVVSGEKATAPAAPTKTGYTFTGWDPDTNAVITAATDFVAQWSADTYTITYMYGANELTDLTPSNYTVEAAVTLPSVVNLGVVGVSFEAWTNAEGTVVSNWVAGAKTGNQTFYAKTAAVVPTTIDPASGKLEVTVTAESAEAAIADAPVTAPSGSGADAADYKALFNFTATDNGNGTFTVELTGIKDEVVTGVDTSAVSLLTGSDSTGTITVPAGLYYKITPSTSLPISGTPVSGLSTGASETLTKPGTTQGFFKVELSATPFSDATP